MEPAPSASTHVRPTPSRTPLRLAVVGGRRGQAFGSTLARLTDLLELTAVCDRAEAVLSAWSEAFPQVTPYREFEDLLADDGVDAIFLATPLKQHAQQAIAAMRAGKHVLSEVVASHTMDEAWELVETVERTGRTYMLAENYCFMRPNLLVRNLAANGVLGRLTYLEGAYLHDCRHLMHDPAGNLTWRAELRTEESSVYYPTHSLGPIAQWLRAANGPTDRLETVTGFTTASAVLPEYFEQTFGADHPGAQAGTWRQGDSGTAVITSTSGAVLSVRVDAVSPRPHNMTHYAAQGTNGAYEAARHDGEDPLLWIAGRSPERGEPGQHPERDWESLWAWASEYEDPRWRDHLADAEQAGHGGGDFFVLKEFAEAVRDQRPPEVDVYDAVTWSSMIALTAESVERGNQPVAIPDFGRGRR
ncbi:Gfo/Idh/MocA family protein [Microlunatus sp. Y2014]|uniref:Gfo/Idh/MocA family protein n=1 Tax=Microlunatus sp. Y2014 TaxID=3418488 RepID=UPI003DA764DD